MFYVCYVYCHLYVCGIFQMCVTLSNVCDIQNASCLWVGLQESSKVGEENAGLRQQLGDIQASLHQLTNTNQATLQDAQVPPPLAQLHSSTAVTCGIFHVGHDHTNTVVQVLHLCFHAC